MAQRQDPIKTNFASNSYESGGLAFITFDPTKKEEVKKWFVIL